MRPPQDAFGGVPYTLAGLILDLDADDLRSELADAAAVTTWTDRSGNANHVTQSVAGNKPLFNYTNEAMNGHASVDFTKANSHYLAGSAIPICTTLSGADKPFTVFVVVRRSTKVSAEEMLWSLGNSAQASQSYIAGGYTYANSNSQRPRFRIRDDVPAAEFAPSNGTVEITDFSPQVLCYSASGTAANHYVVGASQNPLYDATVSSSVTTDYSAQGTITVDRFAIGAFHRSTVTLPLQGEISRVLIYNRELSASERQRICQHLWNRYVVRGITAPSGLSGLLHHWDASLLSEAAAAAVTTFAASTGGKDFTGAGGARPVVALHPNGNKVLQFDGTDDTMTAGVAADWTFLHNDAEWSAFVVWRAYDEADLALNPILDTVNNATATVRGIGIYHDAASSAHSIQVKIGAANATAVLNFDSQDYGVRPTGWHVTHVTHEVSTALPSTEEEYQIWQDNENFAAADRGVAQSGTDSANTLTLGSLAGGVTFGKIQVAEIIIYNRKLGRPWESQLVNEYLARKWQTTHCALVGGNGLANVLNDATPHRAFPAMCQDENGTWHCIYRRATAHSTSRGVGVHQTSADGLCWSPERVIYDINDADGRDFRGEAGFICVTQGSRAGRLLFLSKWSTDASAIEVTNFASTLILGKSDDNGGSWTFADPMVNDPKNVYATPWDYTASPNGLIELSTGRILMTFTSKDNGQDGNNQDLNLSYSDDGGETWSAAVIIATHDVELGLNKRITESCIIEFADGELLLAARNDTDKEIWLAHSTAAAPTQWTWDGAKAFDGYGRPEMAVDPNAANGVFIVYRNDPGDTTVWRYSSNRGVAWSAAALAFSNLHSTTVITAYATMTYAHFSTDADGNLWLAYGLEYDQAGDADVFARLWRLKV